MTGETQGGWSCRDLEGLGALDIFMDRRSDRNPWRMYAFIQCAGAQVPRITLESQVYLVTLESLQY